MAPYERFNLSQISDDPEILEQLSNDELDIVRYNVYQNIHTSELIKEKLKSDIGVKGIMIRLHMV